MTTQPNSAERTVMRYSAANADINTNILLLVMARMAAMKKVLSPISETRITDMEDAEI